MARQQCRSTEIGDGETFESLPTTLEGATELLRRLGYRMARAYAIEANLLAAATKDRAFTLQFVFNVEERTVSILELEGWPVDLNTE